MSLASARRLFGDEGQFLNRFPCRVIVTAPLSLAFDESFAQVEEHFYIERLRAMSVEQGGAGERFCQELLDRRGARAVCSARLLLEAIRLSGGVYCGDGRYDPAKKNALFAKTNGIALNFQVVGTNQAATK